MSGLRYDIAPDDARQIAYDACIAAYPMLVLDAARGRAVGANQFLHGAYGRGAAPGGMLNPNPHVLYSTAWLELSTGPVVLSLPHMCARHWVMPMIDAWGEIFTALGVRRNGEESRDVAIVGPDWCGALDDWLPAVRAPTNGVWLMGRTLLESDEDGREAGPWSHFMLSSRAGALQAMSQAPDPRGRRRAEGRPRPEQVLERMALLLSRLSVRHAPAGLEERLARIGVERGHELALPNLHPAVAQAVCAGAATARAHIAAAAWPHRRAGADPWVVSAYDRHMDPLERAATAHRGFGFNLREDAVYYFAERGLDGERLNGDRRWRLRFEPRQVPPVGAFWSLTAYDMQGRLAGRTGGRQGLSSRDPLRFNIDGSLELAVQHVRPLGPLAVNWLPAPAGAFRLVLRAYWPGEAILDGRWRPPAIRPLAAEPRPANSFGSPEKPAAALRNSPDIGRFATGV
jgi:hypothetical protein